VNFPALFLVGWTALSVFVVRWLYKRDKAKEQALLEEFREELRDSSKATAEEILARDRARMTPEYRERVAASRWN
jgi:hypothetical protein